ncbi:MAG: hypothetical protein CL887_00090 [Dehalococcoidia bacterium]|nr:hypothetical protein [Dehalococcoidia bacterium]
MRLIRMRKVTIKNIRFATGFLVAVIIFSLVPEITFADSHSSGGTNPEANLKYLFAVFFIVWLAFFIYVLFLSRRVKSMKDEIETLKSMTEDESS